MMAITYQDLAVDEDLGRRILARARIIAPCIVTFDPESEIGKDAISIIKGVIADLPAAGARRTKSVSRNGTSMSFETIAAAFDGDATTSLRALCGAAVPRALPVGSFPKQSAVGRVWPEGEYS